MLMRNKNLSQNKKLLTKKSQKYFQTSFAVSLFLFILFFANSKETFT